MWYDPSSQNWINLERIDRVERRAKHSLVFSSGNPIGLEVHEPVILDRILVHYQTGQYETEMAKLEVPKEERQ